MKWLFLGALLGVLLTVPQALDLTTSAVDGLASKPLLVAFALGAVARPHLPLPRRWTR
ncbi:hypothetical protein BJ965_001064 [Streptomyces luteogriseus]|uniref:Uncharacterized protein n=1 Tax=Streptomyces luteogriseus TaxID=68233 RepID=A0A7W7GDJ6_9ACTN|nr:hypothetical protein [Streptomyces luteogriseus]MBB4711182.1 hypothetical protein [Streptomyces luteogriseus]